MGVRSSEMCTFFRTRKTHFNKEYSLRSDPSSSVEAPFRFKILILLGTFTFISSTGAVLQTKDAPVIERSLLPPNDSQNLSNIILKDDLAIRQDQQSVHNSHQKTVIIFSVKKNHYSENDRDVKSQTIHEVYRKDRHELFRRETQRNPTSRPRKKPKTSKQPQCPNQVSPPYHPNSAVDKRRPQNVSNSGRIVWNEPEPSCFEFFKWLIHVPIENGIVFTFDSVHLLDGFQLKIHSFNNQILNPKLPPLWKFAVDSFLAPLLVRRNQVMLEVRRPPSKPNADKRNRSPESSYFNLTFAAYPMAYLPEEVQVDDRNRYRVSKMMYDCSVYPKKIPKVLQCDMIQHCVGGEDEEGCSYKSAECGDWIPYKNKCLQALFKPILELGQGRSHVTMPIPAEETCIKDFQGILAQLPDDTGMTLVYKIIRQSGYRSAAVGLRKMKPRSSKLKQLYRYMWQWGKSGSQVAYEQVKIQRNNPVSGCAVYDLLVDGYLQSLPCASAPSIPAVPHGFICMKYNDKAKKRRRGTMKRLNALHLPPAKEPITVFPTKTCPDGSLVQTFHECAWNGFHMNQLHKTSIFPDFQCQFGPGVHYSLVCDAMDDCADGSDEISCKPPRHTLLSNITFTCATSQTIPKKKQCNGIFDCFDNSDEEDCIQCKNNTDTCPAIENCIPKKYKEYFNTCHVPKRPDSTSLPKLPPQSLVAIDLDGFGMSSLKPVKQKCGEGFFKCDENLCIPTYLLNNGERDCPTGIDEHIQVQNFTCPGYYRCHVYGNCIHSRHLCDEIPHCPNKDDERYCELSCPSKCTCEGYAYKCWSMFDPDQHLNTRYLDLSEVVKPDLTSIQSMYYLFFLNLSHCKLEFVNLTRMPQLQMLDLSHNLLKGLSSNSFLGLFGLQFLSLSHNPLVQSIDPTFKQFIKHSGIIHLKRLLLVNTGLHSIEDGSFASLTELTKLDLRENDITGFDKKVFFGLSHLKSLQTNNYKLCCPYFHEKTIPDCHAPENELSSCDDLLNNHFYQIFVWILAVLNIPANITVLVYRLREVRKKVSKSYTILVCNLCLSDLLMGIYLVFIGSADVHYRNVWISKENEWTGSGFCKVAGMLAFLSSEVSAFIVCLITLERLLVICFPLKRHAHMTVKSAWWACAFSWLLGFLLVLVPMMAGWELYGQNGFCLPLPITRSHFPGQQYIFVVFIIINFVLFIIIGIGQVCIYMAIKSIRLSSSCHSKLQDMTIARKLMLIIFTDFLCWFPIGLMGLLSSLGVPIPGEVNVWAALFILPFNSALNPHLYTLNNMCDQYRERRMDRRIQKTIGKISAEIPKWPADKVETLIRSCLQARVVEHKKIVQWMRLEDYHVDHEEVELSMIGGCKDAQSDVELTRA